VRQIPKEEICLLLIDVEAKVSDGVRNASIPGPWINRFGGLALYMRAVVLGLRNGSGNLRRSL
jgi:hypothetical protein